MRGFPENFMSAATSDSRNPKVGTNQWRTQEPTIKAVGDLLLLQLARPAPSVAFRPPGVLRLHTPVFRSNCECWPHKNEAQNSVAESFGWQILTLLSFEVGGKATTKKRGGCSCTYGIPLNKDIGQARHASHRMHTLCARV